MSISNLGWLAVLLPLLGWIFSFMAVVPRRTAQICLSFCSLSLILAVVLLGYQLAHQSAQPHESLISFWEVPIAGSSIFPSILKPLLGIRLDGLSAVLLVLVAFVSVVAQWHGIVLMKADVELRRFFQLVSVLTFGVLGAVAAPNLFQFWLMSEVIAVAAYVLVAHWWTSIELAAAARRVYLYLRVGDLALLLGLVVVFVKFGRHAALLPPPLDNETSDPLSFAVLSGSPADPSRLGEWRIAHLGAVPGVGLRTLVVVSAVLLIAAGVRAAQFPFHAWFVEAAGAPPPAVALLTSLVGVTGILLVARVHPLFFEAPRMASVMALIGAGTALFAACAAAAERDLIRLAVLTSAAQLGLVVAGMGMGGFTRPLFALVVSALLSLLLILVAGNVVRAYKTQDIVEIRGLWPRMRWTSAGLAGWVLGVCGLGLVNYNVLASVLGNTAPSGSHRSNVVAAVVAIAVVGAGVLLAVSALRLGQRVLGGTPARRRGVQPERIVESEPRLRRAVAAVAAVTGLVIVAGAVPALGFGRAVFAGGGRQILDWSPAATLLSVAVALAGAAVAMGMSRSPVLAGRDVAVSRRLTLGPALAHVLDAPLRGVGRLLGVVDRVAVDGVTDAVGEGASVLGSEADRTLSTRLGVQVATALGVLLMLSVGMVLKVTGHLTGVHL